MSSEPNPYQSPLATKRLRPRYALLVLVPVLIVGAVFVGYNLNWIARRHDCYFFWFKNRQCGPVEGYPGAPPWSIRWMGARGFSMIRVAKNDDSPWTDADFQIKFEVSRQFPEADVRLMTYEEMQEMWRDMKAHGAPSAD